MTHSIDPSIFKEYDIRGVYGQNLFDDDAYILGKALASYGSKRIVVGYDGRHSSQSLSKNLIHGFTSSGAHVTNIGLCHTPLMYFAVEEYGFDIGVMITGSHNPPDHNGFKIVKDSVHLFGEHIQHIKERTDPVHFIDGLGREIITRKIQKDYIERVLKDVNIFGNIKVIWDIGNGSTSDVVNKIVKRLPGTHIILNSCVDGSFPSHDPDPTAPENLEELSTIVIDKECDFGIAFDGDGDRLVIVNRKGVPIYGDQLSAIFASDILKHNKNGKIIVDIKSSNSLINIIKASSGVPIISKTGHSIIKAKMKESGALFGGETSGHFFFADRWYGFDDGVYSAIRFLEIFSLCKQKGIDIFESVVNCFSTPEIRIDCSVKFEVIERLKSRLKASGIPFIDIDGIRVENEDGWWLVRASNTQDQLTIRIEAYKEEKLNSIKHEVVNTVQQEINEMNGK